MTYADIPSKRIEAHSRICASTVVHLLGRTMQERVAADNALAAHFRNNHFLGARDRRIISETLFSVLRWWGWLRNISPIEFPEARQAADGSEILPAPDAWFACLAASWLLDGRIELPPSASWWLYQSGVPANEIPTLPPQPSIRLRRHCLKPFFDKGDSLPAMPLSELVPSWCLNHIDFNDQANLIEWLQTRPPVWLRAQTNDLDRLIAELSRNDIRISRHEKMKHALKANFSGISLQTLPSYENGIFEVQDAASQAISLICAPNPGEHWWDCCAGAGGKTLHLSWLMKRKGIIQASDNRAFKLEELKKRARRSGIPNIICKEWLGIDVPRLHNQFNGVLVDAPCTCSGTWRRNPGLRWTTDEDSIAKSAELQKRLLANASPCVKPGGVLVYATCSMFKEENIEVIKEFLANHRDFILEPFQSPLTAVQTPGYLQIWPWDSDCDAMFVAKFRKKQ